VVPLATSKAIDYAVRMTCGLAQREKKSFTPSETGRHLRHSRSTVRADEDLMPRKFTGDLACEEASNPFLECSYFVTGGTRKEHFTSQNGTISGSFLTL
jgi:hypothetical protein